MNKHIELVEKRLSQRAFDQFKEVVCSGSLDDMIIYDLVQAARFAIKFYDKELLEALKIVLKYYTHEDIIGELE